MQNIDLICVGKLNAKYFAEGVAEYHKRLAAFASFRIIELPEEMSPEPLVPPQCCAPGPHFAGICSGNSPLPFRKVPSCENRETERPQACRFPENKNILSTVNVRAKRRRF